jgi:hypothetical protein
VKSKNRIGIFISIGVAILVLLAFFIYISGGKQKHSWVETYKPDDKEPYGTYLIATLLKSYFGNNQLTFGNTPLRKALAKSDSSKIKNMLFVGGNLYLDQEDADTLLAFVAKGNNAFIAAQYIPAELANVVLYSSCQSTESHNDYALDSTSQMNFYHPDLTVPKPYLFRYAYLDRATPYEWSYFNLNKACDSLAIYELLGYALPDRPNFIRAQFGKGYFYFHLNPLVFTNYQLLNETALDYCGKVFSHLPLEKTYWDEHGRIPSRSHQEKNPQKGPLSYMLSQVPLRWAWYTLLSLVIAYFLFRAARRQRIIPVILPNENTSLEFVQTVGSLYYQQNDHQKLCIQKMKLFLLYIRNRYYLQTNVLNEALIKKIAVKSRISEEHVGKIFSLYTAYQHTVVEVEADELIAFHKALDYFYRNCK